MGKISLLILLLITATCLSAAENFEDTEEIIITLELPSTTTQDNKKYEYTEEIIITLELPSTTTPDNKKYSSAAGKQALNKCQTRCVRAKNTPCDIIFIGDSITERWLTAGSKIWEEHYKKNSLNFAVSGDKTQNVLWRLSNLDIKTLNPKVAVLLIGTNNKINNPQQIADGIKEIILNTQKLFTNIKIILVSIMPTGRKHHHKMMRTNDIIKNLANNDTVIWLDLVPLMTPITIKDNKGLMVQSYKGLSRDLLHLDQDGYQLYADALEPVLNKLLSFQ